jgi:hypothetical protein
MATSKPATIRFPLSTSPGERPQEGEGRLINCYAEPKGEGQGAVYKRAPGCTAYGSSASADWTMWGLGLIWFNVAESVSLPAGVFRGAIFVDNVIYAVFGEEVFTIILGGSFEKIGDMAGTDKLFFARNNKAPVPDIVMVGSAGAFILTTSSVSAYPDSDVGSPTCVEGHKGFIIFGYGNGDLISTDINVTNINLLNLAKAATNPDGVTQIVSYAGQLYVMGSASVEIFGDPVNTSGFPFNRVGYNIVPGLITPHAVTGFAPEFGRGLIYVASDHSVRWISDAANAVKISTPDLDRLIRKSGSTLAIETDNTNINALCYVADAVPFAQINGPTWSWVFNCENIKWHERKSYLMETSRLTGSVFAFDRWLCGDTLANGRLLEITTDTALEIDQPLIPVAESLPVSEFPIYIACPRVDFEFAPGVGIAIGHDPDQTDPFVEISWSDDGGQFWTDPRFIPVGRQSKSRTRVSTYRTGQSGPEGRRWRVSLPSNVHFGLISGSMKPLATEY